MSDLPNATAAAVGADAAPIITRPAAGAADAPAPAIDPNKVVASVVQTLQAQPDSVIHPSKVASVIASILGGLYQAEPAIFAVSKAGAQTQAEVSLGLGLAEVIVGAFLHPAS